MAYHLESCTQRQHWMYDSSAAVEDIHTATNNEAKQRLSDAAIKRNDANNCDASSMEFLTAKEEQQLCLYYGHLLLKVCVSNSFPKKVPAAASHFFRRFYLHHSVMDYHPKGIMLACIYLACKVEEHILSIDQFGQLFGDQGREACQQALNLEIPLMHALRFHLNVYHAFRPLRGLCLDIQVQCSTLVNSLNVLKGDAEEIIRESLLTDIGFVTAPSKIALAALVLAAEMLDVEGKSRDSENYKPIVPILEKWWSGHLCDGDAKRSATLRRDLDDIIAVMKKPTTNGEELKKAAKRVDSKLRKCQNPELNPESDTYKLKTENENAARAEKRARKLAKKRAQEAELRGISDNNNINNNS